MGETKPRILIVDDDDDFREIISAKLEAKGFSVESAQDGEEGVEKAKKNKHDLILLDVEMPKMNGIETLAKIKEDPDLVNVPILFFTNYGEAEEKSASIDDRFAKDVGAAGHVRKAEDFGLIVDRIKEILNIKS